MRYCSNIVQPGPTIFYLPSSKDVITNLTDERERVMYAKQMLELSDSNIRKFLKEAPNCFINFLCECLLKVINGNVPVNKQLVTKQEDSFKQLLSKETSLKKQRFILARKSEDIKAIGFSCYLYLKVK